MVRMIDNEGKTVWTFLDGAAHSVTGNTSYSIGFSIVQVLRLVFYIMIFVMLAVIHREWQVKVDVCDELSQNNLKSDIKVS